MAAKVIAHNVTDFHKSPEGQRFQQEHRNAQRLNVMTTPDEIADYVARNHSIQPLLDTARDHRGVLYGIKLTHERQVQQLFFRHAMMPALRMQITIAPGWHGKEMTSTTAATNLDADKNGKKPDPAFTPMIRAVLCHLAQEQQIARLAKSTGLPLADAREATTVPWMPFFARQLSHNGATIRHAKISRMPSLFGQHETTTFGELDIVTGKAPGNKLTITLTSESLVDSKVSPITRQGGGRVTTALARQDYEAFAEIYACIKECQKTIKLAGSDIVESKPWALDVLHVARENPIVSQLVLPVMANTAPEALYVKLICESPLQSGQTSSHDLVVKRNGDLSIDDCSKEHPLPCRLYNVDFEARKITGRYPLPQRYP